ncbi:MAG: 4-hydroxy-3-methylbut-2-enyl diphosphate reductase [Gemmatimonadota bacterium]|jgi:4-hydroxy-3-methylbut-2-enyl diphosphate reductase|nr:4-hydroxy-3-methylbut-2-enyl diphosphate reductase [Gemmatimonadota bacterium]
MEKPVSSPASSYFRRGFGLTREIAPIVEAEYNSELVERIRAAGNQLTFGEGDSLVSIRLADSFGFCYGVDRAVDYAYQARVHFPERRLFLVGEIIHNPHVNSRLREMGIVFLYPGEDGCFDFSGILPEDVVILPAFGVTLDDFASLSATGCSLVDTTCGSVLNVWKRVDQYAREGFTALIHGKYRHEETKATASQVFRHPGGQYIVVFDLDEARLVMDYLERAPGALSRAAFLEHFNGKTSPGFDPDLHLSRIGCANQTTMLAGESLEIAAEVGQALERRYRSEPGFDLTSHFQSFDTICSATQERQDAIVTMMKDPSGPPDAMVVIGGYNSSNTNHLAVMCARWTATYHIADAEYINPGTGTIRFKPAGTLHGAPEIEAEDWLPPGAVSVGLTAGASTPNNKIGEAVERILSTRGISIEAPSRPG